jgi:ribonuclease HI
MTRAERRFVLVHADESCLRPGGMEGPAPGGGAALIEIRTKSGIARRDIYISSPTTTNNRMALAGAIATFALLSQKGQRLRIHLVSDSRYLVDGFTAWLPNWKARGWRRKGGPIENLELWQKLAQAAEGHDVTFEWVRGHDGHLKNEYVNDLAIKAARDQVHSSGAEASKFAEWLAARRTGDVDGVSYDPDVDFEQYESEHGTVR